MRRIECASVVAVSLLVLSHAVAAQDVLQPPANGTVAVASFQLPVARLPLPVASFQSAVPSPQLPAVNRRPVAARPHVLLPLEIGFAATQALDYVTTTRAIGSGMGREANPLMAPIAGNRPAFIAVKAASTAGVIWMSERLWKKNRVGAIVLMAVADGVMGAVVAHNQEVGGRR